MGIKRHRKDTIRQTMSSTIPDTNDHGRTAGLFADQLDNEIGRRERELEALLHARNVLRGADERHHHVPLNATGATATASTVSERVEQILARAPQHQMHLDEIIKALHRRFQIRVSRKNLANTLNRWLARGKKFNRVAANTYTLR